MNAQMKGLEVGVRDRLWLWGVPIFIFHFVALGIGFLWYGSSHASGDGLSSEKAGGLVAGNGEVIWLTGRVFSESEVDLEELADASIPTEEVTEVQELKAEGNAIDSGVSVTNPLTGSNPVEGAEVEAEVKVEAEATDGGEEGSVGDTYSVNKEWYDRLIYTAFRRHWKQPSVGANKGELVGTDLRVVIAPDGLVDFYEVSKESGNSVLDASVLRAASKVRRLPPLPDELGSAKYEVVIRFQLR